MSNILKIGNNCNENKKRNLFIKIAGIPTINVATKSVNDYSLDSTKTSTSLSTLIMVIFMIVIPVILIAMAVIVYAKRKNL